MKTKVILKTFLLGLVPPVYQQQKKVIMKTANKENKN
jgi:hypothetical protein